MGCKKCIHNVNYYTCKNCPGPGICEHNKRRHRCKDCGGSYICEHNRIRNQCKDCGNALEITIKNMIKNSKKSDRKSNRNYQESDYISIEFLTSLFNNNPELTCYHCDIKCQYLEYNPTLITIERLDNSLAHIKTNCVLACLSCNSKN